MNSIATEADIRSCFRLILGRDPNPEELPGHLARAGEPLDVIVASYLNSAEFAARGLMSVKQPTDVVLVDFPAFKIFADINDAAVGRHVAGKAYEPEVESIFRDRLKDGMSVIDIGANIGYFTMLSRSLVGPKGRVFAIEPNVNNLRMIEASRRINGFVNLDVLGCAASDKTELMTLHSEFSNGSVASAREVSDLWTTTIVPAVVLDDFVGNRQIDFIKVDVEGNELRALLGLEKTIERCRPFIVSEFSAAGIVGGAETYLDFFLDRRYELGVLTKTRGMKFCGRDKGQVISHFVANGTDHIDIVAIAENV